MHIPTVTFQKIQRPFLPAIHGKIIEAWGQVLNYQYSSRALITFLTVV
jgi:hypothetical protein